MVRSTATAIIAVLCLFGAVELAKADSFCGSGRHVGAENDGAGKSWQCVPDGTGNPPPGIPRASSGYGPTTGLAAGAAALDMFSALAGILDSGSAAPSQEDLQRQAIQRQVNQEFDAAEAQAKADAGALADTARKAAQAGDYATARDDFQRAYERSSDYGYYYDMSAMDALLHLQQAITMAGYGRTSPAYTEFVKAETLAKQAHRPDIADRIEGYRVALFAVINADLARDAKGARDASRQMTTQCVPANGDFVCD